MGISKNCKCQECLENWQSLEHLKKTWGQFIHPTLEVFLEQSAVVWHFSLTEQNKQELERVQQSTSKIIFKNKYESYHKSLELLILENLNQRRINLCRVFAKKLEHNSTLSFELSESYHTMETRKKTCTKEHFAELNGLKNLLYQECKVCWTWNNEQILITIVNFGNGECYGSGQQG